ncbi:MAG: protein kinase [Phycisphaerales bacterium]|nr:protein kinase [Phycisphaerales bacterium]
MGSGAESDRGTPEGCLDLASLDALAAGVSPGSRAAEHLSACDRCRGMLEEMRGANRFLQRFASGGPDGRTAPPADGGTIRVRGYEVSGMLAFGGQGAVYRAVQSGTGRPVAIKVPLGDAMRRPSTRYRFQREIELTARLDHPGIVRVIGPCELTDGRLGCVMEFIEGEPFDRWADARRAEGRGAIRGIVQAAAQIADAIAFAHQRAILHRDIKPSNVVVTAGGAPHILDFGLAKSLDESAHSFATLTGAFVGTLSYSAPEQVSGGAHAIDMRTDVYALGLLLYQALTGRLPHDADAPTAEILRQIRELAPPRPSSFAPGVGNELDAVLLKALAKEPDRRYASAAEMRDDLRAWLDGRAVRARFDSRWYVLRKTLRRHRWAALLAGAGLVTVTTMATLGLIVREQSVRARLADAVRDARVLESHWVRLADARSTAIDNLEAGEHAAWDALLDPDPVLLGNAIEGIGAVDAPKPAYWALWEIYQRTPLVFTVPVPGRRFSGFDTATGEVIVGLPDRAVFQWWDPSSDRLLREVGAPELARARGLGVSPDSVWGLVIGDAGPPTLVNLRTGLRSAMGDETALAAALWNDRAVVLVKSHDRDYDAVLWDTSADLPAQLARYPISSFAFNAVFDASGEYLAVTTEEGRIIIADARSGETLYSRTPDYLPRFVAAHSRGVPGEFLFYGAERIAQIQMPDPEAGFAGAKPRSGFLEGVRALMPSRGTDRYIAVTDRGRIGVGDKKAPITEGTFLPAISASNVIVSDDGRFVCASVRPSTRTAVLSLEGEGARRLPFPAPITTSGYATVFDVEFSPDGRSLLAGAMDGSVRAFDVLTASPIGPPHQSLARGVSVIRAAGGTTFLGTHDMGLADAEIIRLDDGGPRTLISGKRWICGLEVEPGVAAWALTGRGELVKLNPESGELLAQVQLERHAEAWTRAFARVPELGILLAGPAGAGIVLLDERTLEECGPSVPAAALRHIAVSPADPTLVATAGDDGMVRLWRLRPGPPATLSPISQLGAHAGGVFGVAFSPDGRLLATGGGTPESKDIRLWDIHQTRELAALDLFEMGVFDLAFSPDGRWLAAGGEVRLDHPEEGGQLFLIDLQAPDRCLAGNLEYHIARFAAEHGREPSQAGALRRWAERARGEGQ